MKSENIHETIEDVQEFGLTQDEIIVSANQEATLDFKENEKWWRYLDRLRDYSRSNK